jgi:tetraacyldisaccharide 4'-kinase
MCLNYLYNLATDGKNGLIDRILKFFLFILSLIYGVAVKLLILFYSLRPAKFACKVISVGNITLGGTGKTSLVEIIARYLKDNGRRVAIISRGYGRRKAGSRQQTNYLNMGDEPYMLVLRLKDVPVIVDPNRTRAIKSAIKKYGVDTVILDDGFQQWKIKKDLDIVVMRHNNPFGNRCLVPRGILREPISSLKRAGIFVVNRTDADNSSDDLKKLLSGINPAALIFEAIHKPLGFYKIDQPEIILMPEDIKARVVVTLSGIGNPAAFEDLIKRQGLAIGLSFKFADHFRYEEKDLKAVFKQAQEHHIDTIITTEKDAVRIRSINFGNYPVKIFVLKVKLEIIKDEERFYHRLLKLYPA